MSTQKNSTVYVSFSAEIVAATTESLIATVANFVNQGVEAIYLMLSTPGGSVMHGMTLYNTLRALPVRLITHNVGNVDSIGNMVFQAGTERFACPHSTFMFHGVAAGVSEGKRLEEKYLAETLEGLRADQKRVGSVLLQHTNLTEEGVLKMFLEAQTMNATDAAKFGVVDEVKDVEIPRGAPIVSLVFKR